MLQQMMTGTNAQTTGQEYDYELPNTEPTENGAGTGAADLTYTKWKAKNHTTSARVNLGGTDAVNETANRWYNFFQMFKYRKILKRYAKFGHTGMSA
jgi:hypothetical protein